MTKKNTELDMDFGEALKRFAKTNPKELNTALEDYEIARKLARGHILSEDDFEKEVEDSLKGGATRGKKKFRL